MLSVRLCCGEDRVLARLKRSVTVDSCVSKVMLDVVHSESPLEGGGEVGRK